MKKTPQGNLASYLKSSCRDGMWSYFPGRKPALEPTIWASVALRQQEGMRHRFAELLAKLQNEDGGWSGSGRKSDWTTGLALLALKIITPSAELSQNESFKRGVSYLMENRTDYHSGPGKFFLLLTLGAEYDYPRGWPWTEKTYDWVEPTAYALLALENTRVSENPRVKGAIEQGKRFLLKCALEHGGWDYAARDPGDPAHVPYPSNTAQAILALPEHSHSRTIKRAAEFLLPNDGQHGSTLSLAWSAIALDFLGYDTGDKLHLLEAKLTDNGNFPEDTDTVSQALACLAFSIAEQGNPFRIPVTEPKNR